MKVIIGLVVFIASLQKTCIAQSQHLKPSKVFVTTGYGLGGAFFARDYDEATPSDILGYKAFLNKNFIGTAQEIAVGIHLKKNIDVKVGYNRQRFTRRVYVNDTLAGVGLIIDHRIQHVDNNWFASITKNYVRAKSQVSWGAGLYYWTGQLHTVEIYSRYIIDQEIIWKGSYNGDIGAYAELGYEYKFQPKVNIGIKGQFFWIVSGSYPESVALFPFIKLNF